MEVKPGYKQTEVGVIPEEWEMRPFADLFAFRNGVNADKAAYGQGVRFINVLEPITYSHIYGPEITGQVTLPEAVVASYAVRRGDVLFNRTSETQEEVALAAAYLGAERVVFGGFVIRGRPLAESFDPVYAGYALRAPCIRSQIIPMGQGAVRANVGQQNLGRVLAPLPPLPEQRAIATALSDVDGLLGGLDRLIAKKRDLKQAAMQQLLTGQTRLPGFTGEWEVRKLPTLATIAQGQVDPRIEPYRSMLLVGPEHVESGTGKLLACRTARDQQAISGKYLFKKGDVVYGKINPYLKKVFLADFEGLCSADMYPMSPSQDVSPGFLLALILGSEFSQYAESVSVRSGMPKINREEMSHYSTRVPSSIAEQTAIASVLSDMDTELSALEQRLAKTRALKQAMMQELLTGRTRLV
jgi:type I restriction enzyme S subunit